MYKKIGGGDTNAGGAAISKLRVLYYSRSTVQPNCQVEDQLRLLLILPLYSTVLLFMILLVATPTKLEVVSTVVEFSSDY